MDGWNDHWINGSTEQVSITNVQLLTAVALMALRLLTADTIIVQLQNSGGSGSTVINTPYVTAPTILYGHNIAQHLRTLLYKRRTGKLLCKWNKLQH